MKSVVLVVVADGMRIHLAVERDRLVLVQWEVALHFQWFGRFHCCVYCPVLEEDAKRRCWMGQESYSVASHSVYKLVQYRGRLGPSAVQSAVDERVVYRRCGEEVLPKYPALMQADFWLSRIVVNVEVVLEGKKRFSCVCRPLHLMKMPDDSRKTYE